MVKAKQLTRWGQIKQLTDEGWKLTFYKIKGRYIVKAVNYETDEVKRCEYHLSHALPVDTLWLLLASDSRNAGAIKRRKRLRRENR